MWKICTKCGKHKALWAFSQQTDRGEFGLHSWCRSCNNKRYKIYHNNNQEKERVYRKKYDKQRWIDKKEERALYYTNRRHGPAPYDLYYTKLTVDEEPRRANGTEFLETKCKYCKKYFLPSVTQVETRIRCLYGISAGESNLYCSEECKTQCPVYGKYAIIPSTSLRESIPKELREEVIKRANGICERCGKNPIENIHHEKSVATHPHLQLDKDNLWGVCEECHYDLLHQLEGCSLSELRKKSINNCPVENKILDKQ